MAKKSSKTAHVLNLISSSASEQPQKAKEEKNEQKTPSPVQKIFEKTAKNEEISNRIKNGLLKELEKEAGMGGGLTAGKETADVIPGAAADISVKDTGSLSASLGDITDNDGTLPANTEDGFNDYTESPNKQDNTDSGGYDTQNSPDSGESYGLQYSSPSLNGTDDIQNSDGGGSYGLQYSSPSLNGTDDIQNSDGGETVNAEQVSVSPEGGANTDTVVSMPSDGNTAAANIPASGSNHPDGESLDIRADTKYGVSDGGTNASVKPESIISSEPKTPRPQSENYGGKPDKDECQELAEKEKEFKYINICELLVQDLADEYMEKFSDCRCSRCRADVMALALTKLPPKYIVTDSDDILILINYYKKKLMIEGMTALTTACFAVNGSPRH